MTTALMTDEQTREEVEGKPRRRSLGARLLWLGVLLPTAAFIAAVSTGEGRYQLWKSYTIVETSWTGEPPRWIAWTEEQCEEALLALKKAESEYQVAPKWLYGHFEDLVEAKLLPADHLDLRDYDVGLQVHPEYPSHNWTAVAIPREKGLRAFHVDHDALRVVLPGEVFPRRQ